MIAQNDLECFKLQLLDANRVIQLEQRIEFHDGPNGLRVIDSAAGHEMPVLPNGLIATSRCLVHRRRQSGPFSIEAYRHVLKINWSTAEKYNRAGGSTIESEHTARITGGRQTGQIHVSDAARRRLQVTRAGGKYAFARDIDSGQQGIWLHPKFVEGQASLCMGSYLSAIVISTPRGLQGRSIRTLS